MKRHYSVRESYYSPGKYKIVIAGGTGIFGGLKDYEDLNLPYFNSFDSALSYAERLNKLVKESNVNES